MAEPGKSAAEFQALSSAEPSSGQQDAAPGGRRVEAEARDFARLEAHDGQLAVLDADMNADEAERERFFAFVGDLFGARAVAFDGDVPADDLLNVGDLELEARAGLALAPDVDRARANDVRYQEEVPVAEDVLLQNEVV